MSRPFPLAFAGLNLALGAGCALIACTPFAGPALRLFTMVQAGTDPALADAPFAHWLLGILGGIWAGWGATMMAVLSDRPMLQSMRIGLLTWFSLDSLASVINGAPLNVAVNLSFLVLGLVALRSPAKG